MSEEWARKKRPFFDMKFIPKTTEYTRPFWEGTKRGEFLIQECADCGERFYPPGPICRKCASKNLKWIKSSGKGKVGAFTTIHAFGPSWVSHLIPYTIILVMLEEGVVVMSHIKDCKPEDVKIDMEVEMIFEEWSEDFILPYFKPI